MLALLKKDKGFLGPLSNETDLGPEKEKQSRAIKVPYNHFKKGYPAAHSSWNLRFRN